MKKISVTVLILLLFVSFMNMRSVARTKDVSAEPARVISAIPEKDADCLKCFEDSIMLAVEIVKTEIAVMDSISRRVYANAQKIADNNRSISMILDDCSSPPEPEPVKRELNIESRKARIKN